MGRPSEEILDELGWEMTKCPASNEESFKLGARHYGPTSLAVAPRVPLKTTMTNPAQQQRSRNSDGQTTNATASEIAPKTAGVGVQLQGKRGNGKAPVASLEHGR